MRYLRKFSLTRERKYCTKQSFAKPYQDIPGPKGVLGLGNIYKYLPVVGQYSWLALHKAGADKYKKFGPIVKETMVPGEDILWLYDPRDISTLLNEKDYPLRRSHLALEKYRKDRPHVYNSAGLLQTNGPEWWRLRSELQKDISAPKRVRSFLLEVDKVTKEFLDFVPKNTDNDILANLTRLNLELTCLVTFGTRLHSFDESEQIRHSRSSKLIDAAATTNSNILPTDQGFRLWRYFETSSYKKLRRAQEYMEKIAVGLVSENFTCHNETPLDDISRTCLVQEYIKNPNLDFYDVIGAAADFLLAGIDTTSYATAFVFYYISRHPLIQRRLYEESLKVLREPDSPILADNLKTGIPYTRAVLKEVFRLNPISIGVGRILSRDLILGGYHVPKETVVVTQNMVACRLEQNFKDALTFRPERWLNNGRNSINPYLVLPFGHGIRACIARRFAEQNILVLLLRTVRNYEIMWRGVDSEMDVVTVLINKPSKPVIVQLKHRS